MEIVRIAPNRWLAPSVSHPGSSYELSLADTGLPRCSCPGYTWRRRCKHCDALAALLRQQTPRLTEEARRRGISELQVLFGEAGAEE